MKVGHSQHDAIAMFSGRTRSRRFRQGVARISLMIAAFVVVDVLIGLTLCRNGRFMGRPLPPYDLTFTDRQLRHLQSLGGERSTYSRFDPDLGWSLRSNGESDGTRANSAGFRANREYSYQVPPGVTRIAAFGDSYTHGHGVTNEETWSYLLEQANANLEVLNFGVNGYGTDQAYLRYLRDGAQYHPDIVLIGVMVENILRNVSVYRPAYAHGTAGVAVKPRYRLGADGELELLPCPVRSAADLKRQVESRRLLDALVETDYWVARAPKAYQNSPLFLSSIGRITYAAYEQLHPPKRYYRDIASEPFQVTARILLDFHAKAVSNGSNSAIVLFFPNKCEVRKLVDGKAPYWESMMGYLRGVGVPVVDLSPSLVEAVRRDGIDTYFRGAHLSPSGNQVVADTILKVLAP